MIRSVILVSVIALSTPVLAQNTPSELQQSATPAPAEQDAIVSAQTAEPSQASPANTVTDVIESDFDTYDADKNGTLNEAEFAQWMLKLRAANPEQGKPMAAADLQAWTNAAFAQADTDKNKSVNKDELTRFLAG